jgi:hypothetical protein
MRAITILLVVFSQGLWGAFTLGHMLRTNREQRNVEDRFWQQWLYKQKVRAWLVLIWPTL